MSNVIDFLDYKRKLAKRQLFEKLEACGISFSDKFKEDTIEGRYPKFVQFKEMYDD